MAMQFFEIKEHERTLGNIGRAIMDLAVTEKDDAMSNRMSSVGNMLTTVGAPFGTRLKDITPEDSAFIIAVAKSNASVRKLLYAA